MSLLATRVQDWVVDAQRFDSNMTRPCEYGALDYFAAQTEDPMGFVTPELRERAINSIGRGLDIPVINYDGAVTVSNARSCTIPDSDNTSALYKVVFQTFSVGFSMIPALHMNNYISYEHDFSRKMEKVTRALANALDQAAVATLSANKTQVFADTLNYTVTANVVQDANMEIVGDIDPLMRANCYSGNVTIIGNAGIESAMRKIAQLGLTNGINRVLEWAGKDFRFTNNIVNESGVYGTGFAVENGNVAVLTRSGRENLLGTVARGHEFGIVNLPILGLPVDYHLYMEVGDQSAVAGESSGDMTCNLKEYYGYSIDVAFIVKYNSDPTTVANPIIEFQTNGVRAAVPVYQVSAPPASTGTGTSA